MKLHQMAFISINEVRNLDKRSYKVHHVFYRCLCREKIDNQREQYLPKAMSALCTFIK